MKRSLLGVVGLVALSGVLGAVATGCSKSSSATTAGNAPIAAGVTGATGATGPSSMEAPGGIALEPLSAVPRIGQDIVKTARLSVEVRRGGFDDAFDHASVIAGTYGGFVESSSTEGVKSKQGSLTIRVPAASFEDAMHDLRGIGTVQRQSISGRDVTSQFVDLEARLRNFETQEKVLLGLLSKATTIEGTLRVQRTLSDVQLRIEELTGERRVLANRTELSTIDVDLFEAGAPVRTVVEATGVQKPQLSEAVTRAEAVFLGLVYGIVVGLAVVVPLGLVGVGVWLLVRRYRARVAA